MRIVQKAMTEEVWIHPELALSLLLIADISEARMQISKVRVEKGEGAQSKPFVDFKDHWRPQSVISSVQSTNDHHRSSMGVSTKGCTYIGSSLICIPANACISDKSLFKRLEYLLRCDCRFASD